MYSSFLHSMPHRTFALALKMRAFATKLIINGAQILSLTTLSRFRISLEVPNTLHLSSRFRTRISQCADILLCCLSLVRIQSYLQIIISLELSVLLTSLLGYIPQGRFSRFFIRTSLSGAVVPQRFPVIGRALG